MSRTERFRPARVALVAGAVVGALALAGCGAGQISQTADQVAAVSGANVTEAQLAIRNAEIEYPATATQSIALYRAGADAPLSMTIVNESDLPDRLISASSPVAGSVQLVGDTLLPSQKALVLGGRDVTAPPNARAVEATLVGLNQDLNAGLSYDVVLVFERAGAITVSMPMGNADNLIGAGPGAAPATPAAPPTRSGH